MYSGYYWLFQRSQNHAKVAQQDISELTSLAAGLLAFERAYCQTHGERTPVFRMLSIINSAIAEQISIIERHMIENPVSKERTDTDDSALPF